MNRRIAVGLAVMLAVAAFTPARAQRPFPTAPPSVPTGRVPRIVTWAPEYTSFLALTKTDDLVELDLAGDTLWLSSERVVSRFYEGVWAPLETVSDGGYVFAVVPVGTQGDAWAFGYEGRTWRRSGGTWAAWPAPTSADLYDAVVRSPDDVWAVGFDYDAVTGVVVHFDGRAFEAETHAWLSRQLLRTIAGDHRGELWAGGCNGNDLPFMMRDRGSGTWEPVPLPAVGGCVQHLSFTSDGRGLAALDRDILWWDGEGWQTMGVSPPEGFAWVRVAALRGGREITAIGPPSGWAIPGEPTWRGYIKGQAPWRFEGGSGAQAKVDYRGYDDLFAPDADNPNSRPFLDLVTDGTAAWSISRSGGSIEALQRLAAVVSLSGDTARLAHPLMLGPVARSGGDIATLASGDVWAGTQFGAAPFIRHADDHWSVAPGTSLSGGGAFSIYQFDFASPTAGWAVGALYDVAPSRPVAWRWDGTAWFDAPVPPVRALSGCVRALPDGRAWSLDPGGRLVAFDGRNWVPMDGAPPLEVSDADGAFLRAPFDVAEGSGGSSVGWAASGGQMMYAWVGDRWAARQPIPRGVVQDLQLVDAAHGWAIGRDRNAVATNRMVGVLLALVDRRWVEVDLSAAARRLAATGDLGERFDYRWIEWRLMAPVSAGEVWLTGTVALSRIDPFLVAVRVTGPGPDGTTIDAIRNCPVQALSAAQVPGGTDVWLLGTSACGSTTTALRASFTGPVSRLRTRDVASTVFLPSASRGGGG